MTRLRQNIRQTLMIDRREVARLLDMDACIAAVEVSLVEQAEGRALGPGILALHAEHGSFHAKAGGLRLDRLYVAAKLNSNFPGNPASGKPTIQGVVTLFDGADGRLLALIESGEITALRTAAMTAVAAKHLAPEEARAAAVVGCGLQGRYQLRALARVLKLERVFAIDRDPDAARRYAAEMGSELGIAIESGTGLEPVTRAEVCVTCTTADRAFLGIEHVRPGTFVAAIGADNPEKQELTPALMAAATVVVDQLQQCAEGGDLRHALTSGAMWIEQVHGELAELVAGRKPGRRTAEEITVFDSSGTALQDVAAAAAVYEKARAREDAPSFAFG